MNTTAVIVTYNTPELIYDCVKSILKFYPRLPILIIDNSPIHSECYQMCKNLSREFDTVKTHFTFHNIGHGRGLHLGINMVYTENVLIVDSDTEMLAPCLETMEKELKTNVYGIGQIVQVNEHGVNVFRGIKYLHPYFALIKKKMYDNNPGFIHHGAPFIKTMCWIHDQNKLGNSIELKNKDLKPYVLHKERGTRNVIEKMSRKTNVIRQSGNPVRATKFNVARK